MPGPPERLTPEEPDGCIFWPRRASEEDPLYLRKPFDEWHAWQDLCKRARYGDTEYVVKRGREVVPVNRGQYFASHQFLAVAWGWSHKSRVFRFLQWCASKKGSHRVKLDARPGGTLITILKYDYYQNPGTYFRTKNQQRLMERITDDRAGGCPTPPDAPRNDAATVLQPTQFSRELSRETASGESGGQDVDNMPRMVARVFEAYKLAAGLPNRAPTVMERVKIEAAVTANGGNWRPIAAKVREVTARAVAQARELKTEPPRSVCYGLAAWKKDRAAAVPPADPRARELVAGVTDTLTSRPADRELPDEEHRSIVGRCRALISTLGGKDGDDSTAEDDGEGTDTADAE